MDKSYSRHIFVKTNLSCNLNCVYCYDKNKNDSIFNIDDAFRKISKILQVKTTNGTKIKLIGGEPFLVFTQIKKLCENIWSMNFEEDVHFYITTNGTLVHGEIKNWLYENRYRVMCKLSLDGNKSSHNLNRPNSFEKIDINFFSQTWPDCTVNMVITPQTISSLANNVIFIHQCGFKNIVPIFAILTDWNNCKKELEFYNQLLILADFYINNPQVKRCHILRPKLYRILDKSHDKMLCDIGRKMVYDINSDKYYPCHLFFPSVSDISYRENLNKFDFSCRSKYEHPYCLKCPFINICHTCYAANFIERGGLANRNMSICIYRKISFLVAAKLEFKLISNLQSVSDEHYETMLAIRELLPILNDIETEIYRLRSYEQ